MSKQKYINNAFRAFRSLVTNEGRTARLHTPPHGILLKKFFPDLLKVYRPINPPCIFKSLNKPIASKKIFIGICAAAKNQGRIHHPTIPRKN
jgi:hypothetical protein